MPHVEAARQAGIGHVGINFFPLPNVDDYRALAKAGCNFAVLFQESYDPATYMAEYYQGPKSDMRRRLNAHDLACQGGIPTVGLGILGGLSSWRFDVLFAIAHAQYLQHEYGTRIIFGQYRIKEARGADSRVLVVPLMWEQLAYMGYVYSLAVPGCIPWLYASEDKQVALWCVAGGGCALTITCSSAVGGYAATANGPAQFVNISEPFDQGLDWWKRAGFKVRTSSL